MTALHNRIRPSATANLELRHDVASLGPNLGDCYSFWDLRRNGKVIPSRFDLDPPYEIMHLMPRLCLFDVESLAWRMIGSDFLALMDMNERSFSHGVACERLKEFMSQCRYVCEEWEPRLTVFAPESSGDCPHVLFLPLSESSHSVSTVLACVELRNNAEALVNAA